MLLSRQQQEHAEVQLDAATEIRRRHRFGARVNRGIS